MAYLGATYDPNQIEPSADLSAIPAGEYVAMIVDSDIKQTKNGNGSYLNLQLQILEGEFKGRVVFDRLNLDNPNSKTVEIAQRQLSAICHAAGHLKPVSDSLQLHNIPMVIKVAYVAAEGQYAEKNEVKAYKQIKREGFQPQAQQAPAQSQAAPAASGGAPWERVA